MPERVTSDCSQGTFFWVFRLLFFFAWAIWLWARKAMHWCTHLHMKGFFIPFLNQSGWSVHQWIIFKTETEDDPLTQSPKFWKTLFRHRHQIKYAPLLLSDQGNCMVLQALRTCPTAKEKSFKQNSKSALSHRNSETMRKQTTFRLQHWLWNSSHHIKRQILNSQKTEIHNPSNGNDLDRHL